jgi:hypothetical protein
MMRDVVALYATRLETTPWGTLATGVIDPSAILSAFCQPTEQQPGHKLPLVLLGAARTLGFATATGDIRATLTHL